MPGHRRPVPGGQQPLPAKRKWQAITIATLVLVPGYWALLAALVSLASDGPDPFAPAAGIAFGLATIPFGFVALAFVSAHPRAPGAVVRAMGLTLLVGIPTSAVAADAVTGIVAGIGAGGIVALRSDLDHRWTARALGVLAASVYAFVLVRTAGVVALLPAPVFPFTAIGIADHLSERRRQRERDATGGV